MTGCSASLSALEFCIGLRAVGKLNAGVNIFRILTKNHHVAEFGMLLRGSAHRGTATYQQVAEIAGGSEGNDARRGELVALVKKARAIAYDLVSRDLVRVERDPHASRVVAHGVAKDVSGRFRSGG